MITAIVDMTGFNRGIAGLVRATRESGPVVVRKEAGELIKTLVRVSPPSIFSKSKIRGDLEAKVEFDIRKHFRLLNDEQLSSREGVTGTETKSGLLLTGVSSRFLEATAPAANKLRAPITELAALRWKITKSGRQSVGFIHPRIKQKVLLSQTITTTQGKINKVIALAKKSVGRLKAGWMVAVFGGTLQLTGEGQPPMWVTRHASGAKGSYLDGTRTNNDSPTFTIINNAKGIGQKQIDGLVKLALNIRVKAMARNALLFAKGKKRLGDYAK